MTNGLELAINIELRGDKIREYLTWGLEPVISIEIRIGEFVVLNRINDQPAVLNTGRSENLRQSLEIVHHFFLNAMSIHADFCTKKFIDCDSNHDLSADYILIVRYISM